MDQVSKDQYVIEKNGNKYEVVIGLEVHAQVLSDSKLFSTSSTILTPNNETGTE